VEKRAASLLKYRFGTLAEMHNHLHVVEGRTIFFYRAHLASSLAGGAPVVVEFAINDSEQLSSQRGSVLARFDAKEGEQTGVWLEFPDVRLAKRAEQGMAGMVHRHGRRLGCDFLVEVSSDEVTTMARMIDVSIQGAHVTGTWGLLTGTTVHLKLLGVEPPLPTVMGRAEVVRTDATGSDVAIKFVRADQVARIAAGKLFEAVQQAWLHAPEILHPPLCCHDGRVLEPPLPHIRART
jgi:hypothetical protein